MIEIENTFAEAFPMKASRLIITALNIDGLSLTCVHVHKKEELPGFGKDFRKIEGKEHDGEKKGEESNNNNSCYSNNIIKRVIKFVFRRFWSCNFT